MTRSLLRIATRKSKLAVWQAEHVALALTQAHSELDTELVPLSTRGDEILDQPLARIGGKGLFLKELERAMLDGRADIAVHSLKDVPVDLEPEFTLAAILPRADASDAFVSNDYKDLDDLPQGARVGTSSLRRQAQLLGQRPDLTVLDLRGNVNTRLAKLDRGDYDAIILATAGLQRLGLGARVRSRLVAPDWLPSPGQAALAVEARANDAATLALFQPLNDPDTDITVRAERAMNRTLGGSCTVPVGAWCTRHGDGLALLGLVGDVATGHVLRAEGRRDDLDAEALGASVAQQLLDQGAERFLRPQQPD